MDTFAIKKQDSKQQVVYAEVYAPGVPDSHGDFMTAEEIRKMAFRFLSKGIVYNIDQMHDNKLTGAVIVESFIARDGDADFISGSWVVGVHIPDPDIWAKVESGELNGFSLEGIGKAVDRVVEMIIPNPLKGQTDEANGHTHRFTVTYGDEGEFLGGQTDTVDGHMHLISKGTATDITDGHSHRFSVVELLVEENAE